MSAMNAMLDRNSRRIDECIAELRDLKAHPPSSYQPGVAIDVGDAEAMAWERRIGILREFLEGSLERLDERTRAMPGWVDVNMDSAGQ